MKRFTDAGRQAIAAKNNYAALSLALMIPDICGSLEDPGPGKSQRRYERWFKQWAEPKFVNLSAEECYQLRCSMIHSGSAEIQILRVSKFSEWIYQAADEWDASVKNNAAVQAEKAKLLFIHLGAQAI